ncbi:MAG: hypothetical protein Q4C70_01480 [Planctomycetia bacterium]|nr:hypothetical protein [Planctomycetia bacterium]
MSDYIELKTGGGFQVSLFITDCNGTALTSSDVSQIQYTVFRRRYGTRTVINGHESASVPVSAIVETFSEPHTGKDCNFQHKITQDENGPFPEYNEIYIIQYRFTDLEGTVHIHEIEGHTSP